MNRGLMLVALFITLGIGLYYYLQPTGPSVVGASEIEVSIERRRMEPPVIRASKGQVLTLQIRTDEEGTLRFEDYDASIALATGRSVELPFVSNAAGKFPVLMYPASAPNQRVQIGVIEVR
jgi:hypothetical protein